MFHISPRSITLKDSHVIVEGLTAHGEIKRPIDEPIGQQTFNRVMSAWGFSYLSTIIVSSMKLVVPDKLKFDPDSFEFEDAKKDSNNSYYDHVVVTKIAFKYSKSTESIFKNDPTELLKDVELKNFNPQSVTRPEVVTINFKIGEEDGPKINTSITLKEEDEPGLTDQLLIYYWKEIIPNWNKASKTETDQLSLFESSSGLTVLQPVK